MSYLAGSSPEAGGAFRRDIVHPDSAQEERATIPSVIWANPGGPTMSFLSSQLRRFLGSDVSCDAEQNKNSLDDGDDEVNRLRSTVEILAGVVAFYENCTRVILLKMEKTSMDGHVGEDTTFYCVIPFRINGEPQGFCFTLGAYSQHGSLGIEHWVRYRPGPVDEVDEPFVSQLGKFQGEFTFSADGIQLLFTELTRQIDSIIGRN